MTRESVKYESGKWEKLASGDLIISSLDRNDSGKYTCYGRDDDNNINVRAYVTVNCKLYNHVTVNSLSLGQETNDKASPTLLKLLVSPDFDITEAVGPEDGTALIGSAYTVQCTAPESFPPAEVTFWKDGNMADTDSPGYSVS